MTGISGEVSRFNFQLFKQSDAMNDAIRNWLPITKRNRLALLIVSAALLLFVVCNFLPYYVCDEYPRFYIISNNQEDITAYRKPIYKCLFYKELWSDVFDQDSYVKLLRSPDIDALLSLVTNVAFLCNTVIMFMLIPFWKIFHSTSYLRMPIAIANFIFAFRSLQISIYFHMGYAPVSSATIFMLIAIVLASVGSALIIFENELAVRHERDVKKMMDV